MKLDTPKPVELQLAGKGQNPGIFRIPYLVTLLPFVALLLAKDVILSDLEKYGNAFIAIAVLSILAYVAFTFLSIHIGRKEGIKVGELNIFTRNEKNTTCSIIMNANPLLNYNYGLLVEPEILESGKDESGEYCVLRGKTFSGIKVYVSRTEFEKAVAAAKKDYETKRKIPADKKTLMDGIMES